MQGQDHAALRVRGAFHRYGSGLVANRDVDLDLASGEILAIVGPNGAGKSTLVHLATGLLRPTSGSVEVRGIDLVRHPAEAKRCLGVAPQSVGLFRNLTVDQHLRGVAGMRGLWGGRRRAAIERVVRECGLERIRRQRTVTLSGGQRRRTVIALAMLSDPPVLVLDEPTIGLDPEARHALWRTLRRLRSEGKAILLTSHYMDEVERLGDRIAIMLRGRIEYCGTFAGLGAKLGRVYRVTETDVVTGQPLGSAEFDSLPAAQSHARERGMQSYSVGRVGLEEPYLRIVADAGVVPEPGDAARLPVAAGMARS